MQFDRAKLKASILYVCSRCTPSELGAVKLHKTLYYADMLHYVAAGTPVTGAVYSKRPLGPVCDALLPTLRELEREGNLKIREVEYFGYRKKEYSVLGDVDVGRLSASELATLDEVVDFVCRNNTAKTISEFSHSIPWEIVEFGDELPYHSALHLIPNQVSQEAFDWASEQADLIESERSKANPLDYQAFAALRDRVYKAGHSQ